MQRRTPSTKKLENVIRSKETKYLDKVYHPTDYAKQLSFFGISRKEETPQVYELLQNLLDIVFTHSEYRGIHVNEFFVAYQIVTEFISEKDYVKANYLATICKIVPEFQLPFDQQLVIISHTLIHIAQDHSTINNPNDELPKVTIDLFKQYLYKNIKNYFLFYE